MRMAVVRSSEITRYKRWCLSAKRFTGGCHECMSVQRCEIPVAGEARISLLEEQRDRATEEYAARMKLIDHKLEKEKQKCQR